MLERLAQQLRTLKNEIRSAKLIIERQNKLIVEVDIISFRAVGESMHLNSGHVCSIDK